MARAHPEQHVPIQFMLHHEHPLFHFLEQERAHLGQSRASYVRWLLEQQFLRLQGERGMAVAETTSIPSAPVPFSQSAAQPAPASPALEPDDDLLASFLS